MKRTRMDGALNGRILEKVAQVASVRIDPNSSSPIYWDFSTSALRVPAMEWTDGSQAWRILEEASDNEVGIYPIDRQGRERGMEIWY